LLQLNKQTEFEKKSFKDIKEYEKIKNKNQQQAVERKQNKQQGEIFSSDSKIILSLVILNKIKIYNKDITKIKLNEFDKKIDLKLINKNDKFNINFRNLISTLKMEIENLDLIVEIGTENAMFTAFVVTGISTFLSILLRNEIKNKDKQKYIVIPKYINENVFKIDISGIFHIDLLHYINNIVLRKRDDKYERTSDRRTYDYSYE